MDRHRFDDNHPGTADSTLGVVGDMALRRQPVDCHVRGVSAKHDAIAERVPANLKRTEEAGKLFGHSRSRM